MWLSQSSYDKNYKLFTNDTKSRFFLNLRKRSNMHSSLFYLTIFWSAILFGATVLLVLRARTVLGRMLALDTLTLILIAFLVLFVHESRAVYYLDAVLVLALLSFIGTLAAAWFQGSRSLSQ